jgi:hypothetical protein
VVGSDRCVVAGWQGGLEFDSEGNLVCVQLCLSVWVVWGLRLRSPFRWRVSHEAQTCGEDPADKACFVQAFCMFFERPPVPQLGAAVATKHVPHDEANQTPERNRVPTVAPGLKPVHHGGMR